MGAGLDGMMQLMVLQVPVYHTCRGWERQGAGVEAFRMAPFHLFSRRF